MRTSEIRPSWLARLGLPLVLLLCFVQSWRPIGGGFDFWAHASIGRWIANHGSIPRHGLFLWSAPDFSWVYHSWLSQWFFFHLLNSVGPIGVMVFTTFVVGAVFTLLWRFWQRRAGGIMPAVAAPLFFIAIFVSTARFQPRQEMLTALLLVIFLTWLSDWNTERSQDERDARRVRLLDKRSLGIVALVALWINLHALVMLAVALVVITALCDAVQYRLDGRARALLLVAALCCAATLCNPWGLHYWEATGQLRPGGQATYIEEWMPVWKRWPSMQTFVIAEAVLFLAALWSWARNPSRRWAELLWLLFTTALFLRSRRLLWIVAIVYLIVMAANARSFDSRAIWSRWRALTKQDAQDEMPPGLRRLAHIGLLTTLVLLIVSFAQVFPQNPREFIPLTGVSSRAPVRAADYILRHPVPPRLFADYEYSSYLHWRLNGPNALGVVPDAGLHPLYIDLFNAYPDAVMQDYFAMLGARPNALKKMDELRINTVILGQPHWEVVKNERGAVTKHADKLATYLDRNAAWKRVFSDATARIWIRRVPRALSTVEIDRTP